MQPTLPRMQSAIFLAACPASRESAREADQQPATDRASHQVLSISREVRQVLPGLPSRRMARPRNRIGTGSAVTGGGGAVDFGFWRGSSAAELHLKRTIRRAGT
jgi:hypothetical protein